MAAIDRPALRMVVLHGDETSGFSPAARMMEDRSHHVTATAHPQEAIASLMHGDAIDLMVIDLLAADRPAVIESIMEMPLSSRPRQIAIFADRSDERLRTVREKLLPSRVSILLRPLHLHRLLTILRKLESRSNLIAGA